MLVHIPEGKNDGANAQRDEGNDEVAEPFFFKELLEQPSDILLIPNGRSNIGDLLSIGSASGKKDSCWYILSPFQLMQPCDEVDIRVFR